MQCKIFLLKCELKCEQTELKELDKIILFLLF